MKIKNRELVIEQLDNKLQQLDILKSIIIPQKGWIRAIRNALNMSGRQFAQRLNVSDRSSVTFLEQNEISGAATIKTMKHAAQALDCIFVYGLVPRTSLKDTIKKQAANVAKKRIAKTSHTMLLEDQQLANEEEKKVFKTMVDEMIKNMPKTLWD
ncbi:MAG: mobile mystery protein A [Candidatus Makaraimicrobium thalassicum]|nr:MAG: mobile mystery protein A [Candidatus Omnitrophota bacterium]